MRIFDPPKNAEPYVFVRDTIEIEKDDTILEFHLTVKPEFISEHKTIELYLAIPSTKQKSDIIARVIPESNIKDISPLLAQPTSEPYGSIKMDVIKSEQKQTNYIKYIEFPYQSVSYQPDSKEFKYTFDKILLYFGKQANFKREVWMNFKVVDSEHIRESIQHSLRYDETERPNQDNIFFGWQLPNGTRFTRELDVRKIGGEPKNSVRKSRNETVKAYSSNTKVEDVWFCISDEVTGKEYTKIWHCPKNNSLI